MYAKVESPVQLIAIKTKDKVYISDNIKNESYFYSKLENFIFDGQELKKTYRKNWFQLDFMPTKISRQKPKKRINQRYELKSGFPESELTPKVIPYEKFDESYEDVSGLYTYKYEEEEEGLEDIEFVVNVIEEIEGEFSLTEVKYQLKHNFLDTLNTHPILLPSKPCSLSKEESYKIIRNHIKNNIDPKYAEITSDYDFCFTVKKKIRLHEPESYTVNINAMHKRRKPKYETRFNKHRSVTIFEVAPKAYQSYTVVSEFTGDNYEDLENNINTYLNELMTKINEPFIECECCKGLGVIIDDNN